MRSTLSSPRLRRILAAYTVNRLGTWIGVIALSLAVFDHTHSAPAVAATLIAAQVLPAFVVPALVARVEASRRRGELSGLYLFEAVVTVALAIELQHFWLPAILTLVAIDGLAALAASALLRTEMARAARSELVPGRSAEEPTDEDDPEAQAAEQKANATLNVAFSLTFVLGPASAGALVAASGASVALLIDAASFVICGALLLRVRPHVEEAAGPSVLERLKVAWDYVSRSRALRALLLTQGVALVFFEAAGPIEVAFAKATLHAGDRGYGILVTAWGAGVVLGSIIFARSPPRLLGAMLSTGTFAVGAAYVGFAVAPTLAVASACAVVGGLGNGIQWAPLVSAVQRLTPSSLHGRVMGALESIGAVSPAIGLALGGALTAATSPRIAFAAVGAGAALSTIGFVRVPLDGAGPQEPAPPTSNGAARPGAAGNGVRDEHGSERHAVTEARRA